MKGIEKGVYILPNLFTTGNLLFGFLAIVRAIQITLRSEENFKICAIFIFIAAVFDMLDGRVARKTNTASKFGVEYDSLCDLVSFGLAPAIVVYLWALQSFERFGWMGLFLYVACGALRLARFNVQSSGLEKKHFQGLPIPMAAMMLVGALLIWEGSVPNESLFFQGDAETFVFILVYLLAFLMVSSIPYRGFKSVPLNRTVPFKYMLLAVIGLMFFALRPWWTLYGMGAIYLVSGPFEYFVLGHRSIAAIKKRLSKNKNDKVENIVVFSKKSDHEKSS
ncbi:MAG: CDP-diacylglycerol--serine O-phosphatidyltransferase [Bdellovibrionales bacterium]|nr:CDP-diacylglycerol--serine O-phosphatidyltransferase [Bdellovibrionales bacterium]